MNFEIKGRIKGVESVINALTFAPEIYLNSLEGWLKNERANMLGGKDAKGKSRKGYREILGNKKLRKRSGKWASQVTGLFSGHIPKVAKIEDLKLTMGVLGKSKHQLQKALEMLQTGGAISSRSQMPVPIYKNLKKIGYTGPWFVGSVRTGLKSKAFRWVSRHHGLVGIKKNGKVYYFDPKSRKENQKGFDRSGLLFIGLFGVRVKKQLTGRYDFYARWDRIQTATLKRGQTAIDKATKMVEKKI